MVRKPGSDWGRESALVTAARSAQEAAARGRSVARIGLGVVRGLFLCGFAFLWGFGALGGLLTGSIPAFVGSGAVAALLWWFGSRLIARARAEPSRA